MRNLLRVALCLVLNYTAAQVTNVAEPPSWTLQQKSLADVETVVLPKMNIAEIIEENERSAAENYNKALKIGVNLEVDYNLFNAGNWSDLPNGDRIWMLNLKSQDASFMRVIFDRYALPEGAGLYLYNKEHSDRIGPYTNSENQDDGILGTWIIKGDDLILEYYEPAAVKGQGRLSIAEITHGYVDFSKESDQFSKLNQSGDCNVDVLCNPNASSTGSKDWTDARNDYINSVARILISRGNQTFLCTGAMIANTAVNATPYFLTANHCLDTNNGSGSSFDASGWSFGFQWYTNTPDCATFADTAGPILPTRVISGAQLVANNDDSDFALFLLDQTPPESWNLFYGGWDRSGATPSEQLGIHHPRGDIMKLCRNDQAAISEKLNPSFAFGFASDGDVDIWRIPDWDYGVTEGGSSGSFLLNQNNQIIGQLAGGFAACSGTTDNGTEDWYGRFDTSWDSGFNAATRLRDWLDPSNIATSNLNGYFAQTLSSDNMNLGLEFQFYPNPSSGIFNFESSDELNYTLYSVSGKEVSSGKLQAGSSELNLGAISSGLYFIQVTNGSTVETRRLVKK